jgi:hypothetical protein
MAAQVSGVESFFGDRLEEFWEGRKVGRSKTHLQMELSAAMFPKHSRLTRRLELKALPNQFHKYFQEIGSQRFYLLGQLRGVENWKGGKSVVGDRKTTGSESWWGRNGNRRKGGGEIE